MMFEGIEKDRTYDHRKTSYFVLVALGVAIGWYFGPLLGVVISALYGYGIVRSIQHDETWRTERIILEGGLTTSQFYGLLAQLSGCVALVGLLSLGFHLIYPVGIITHPIFAVLRGTVCNGLSVVLTIVFVGGGAIMGFVSRVMLRGC
jgi:hypothetical protein